MIERIAHPARQNWQEALEKRDFVYHSMDGMYWIENYAYKINKAAYEALNSACETWEHMLKQATTKVLQDTATYERMHLPPNLKNAFIESLHRAALGWRFDALWDGKHWKLLECNAHNWSGLCESYLPILDWSQHHGYILPHQFNDNLQQNIQYLGWNKKTPVVVSSLRNNIVDLATLDVIDRALTEAGFQTQFVWMDQIEKQHDTLTYKKKPVTQWFHVYPWWNIYDEFQELNYNAIHSAHPLWTWIWGHKGILAVMSELYPQHENLLNAAWRHKDLNTHKMVEKEFYGVEGHTVREVNHNSEYTPKSIYQTWCNGAINGVFPTFGIWRFAHQTSALYCRESVNWKLDEYSRLLPYIIQS